MCPMEVARLLVVVTMVSAVRDGFQPLPLRPGDRVEGEAKVWSSVQESGIQGLTLTEAGLCSTRVRKVSQGMSCFFGKRGMLINPQISAEVRLGEAVALVPCATLHDLPQVTYFSLQTTDCHRPEEHEGRASIAYVSPGGRLGNAMSTYAAMLGLSHQYGLEAMVDLATFQSLDMVFTNIRGVKVLEEELCDYKIWPWVGWDGHVTRLNLTELREGKVTTPTLVPQAVHMWPTGIASEEGIHGAAQFLMSSLPQIRRAFTFRSRFLEAANRALSSFSLDYLKRVNAKRKRKVKVTQSQLEFVCVHIRRTDHLEFEKMNRVKHLSKNYFVQAMDLFAELLIHPVFVIVSDDTGWARSQIPKGFRPYFTGAEDWKGDFCPRILQ